MTANFSDESECKKARTNVVIGTHSGTFHCDEALGCFMLLKLPEYKNASFLRSRDDDILREKCDIIIDVGGEFNIEKKWFDHHQKSFNETLSSVRPEYGEEFNKIKLSSAGLIYAFYGERIISNILKENADIELTEDNLKLVYIQIYRNFISEIDAIDNGVPMFDNGEPLYKIHTHLSARVGNLNPTWEEADLSNDVIDQRFQEAVKLAGKEFEEKVMCMGGSWIKAREIVRKAVTNANEIYKTGEILLLEQFCPWKAHLADLEIEYKIEGIPKLVIFSEKSSSWRVQGVPVAPDSFVGRKFLPEEWRGLRDLELSEKAGIPDLIFVHHSGFIGGAKTKEAAFVMATKSIEWNP